MRQARWGHSILFDGYHRMTSAYLHSQGFRGRSVAGTVAEYKKTQWKALDRGVMKNVEARVRRVAEHAGVAVSSVKNVLEYVVERTNRITLYDASIDAGKLLERAAADNVLHQHIASVLRRYVDIDNDFSRSFFFSDAGQALAEEFGIIEHNGSWYVVEDLPTCRCCDEHVFPDDDSQQIYTDSSCDESYFVHDDCAGDADDLFVCDLTGRWFDESCVTQGVLDDTGDTICVEACLRHRLIVEETDEEGETTYFRAGHRSGGRLAGYHRAHRPWLNSSDPIPNGYIGVELELGFKNGDSGRNKFLSEFVNADGRAKEGPFLFERDGSLGDVPGGMEIVSDPLPLHTGYQAKDAAWRKLLTDLYKAGAEGWRHRRFAGIHVNLCVREESDATIFKYASFIGNARAMSKFVAGRKKIFGTEDGYWKVEPHLLRGRDQNTRMESQFSYGKYSAVNRRSRDCLETRIFGSNIRYEGFMACVEYCVAVMEFVRPLHVLDVSSPTIAGEFRNWLGDATGRFPNLCARLGIVAHPRGSATPSTSRVVPALLAA